MFHQTPLHSLTLLSCENQPAFHILLLSYTWLGQHSTDHNNYLCHYTPTCQYRHTHLLIQEPVGNYISRQLYNTLSTRRIYKTQLYELTIVNRQIGLVCYKTQLIEIVT